MFKKFRSITIAALLVVAMLFASTSVFASKTDAGEWPFSDVNEKSWYYEAVKYVYDNGMFVGVGANEFAPNSSMTRAMLTTVLWRLEGEPATTATETFSDVKAGKWFEKAVEWAAENDIVEGIGEGRFNPDGKITREQVATILFRYSGFKGFDVSERGDLSAFSDTKDVSDWAKDAMSWANATELVQGMDGQLLPKGDATRAQVATFLMRFVKNNPELISGDSDIGGDVNPQYAYFSYPSVSDMCKGLKSMDKEALDYLFERDSDVIGKKLPSDSVSDSEKTNGLFGDFRRRILESGKVKVPTSDGKPIQFSESGYPVEILTSQFCKRSWISYHINNNGISKIEITYLDESLIEEAKERGTSWLVKKIDPAELNVDNILEIRKLNKELGNKDYESITATEKTVVFEGKEQKALVLGNLTGDGVPCVDVMVISDNALVVISGYSEDVWTALDSISFVDYPIAE